MNKQMLVEAVKQFGSEVVDIVVQAYEGDPDSLHSTFYDMEMWEHCRCVEFLYFE